MFKILDKVKLKKAWVISALLLGCIITAFTFSIGLGASSDPQIAPINPQFVNYTPSTDDNARLGYRPSLVGTTYLKAGTLTAAQLGKITEKVFDLSTSENFPSVKDQGQNGTDWAFATYGSLGSCLMSAQTGPDFSENDLIHSHGFDYAYNQGGNAFMSAAYLARWGGPLINSNDPDTWDPDVQYHVQEILQIADQSKNEIKYALKTYGGVYTTMYYDDKNLKDKAYYDSTKDDWSQKGNNHAAVIVGWDDNYPKTNFGTAPAGPGAWIVRNSRGSSWGQEGYFYVSYYDANFGRENFVFNNAEPINNYQYKYEYDSYGLTRPVGYQTSTAWAANVFTSNNDPNQSLVAAAFYALQPNTAYTLSIYTDISDATNPTKGNLATTQSGTIAMAGYHTIQLAQPVKLTNGQNFSVVVKLTTPGYNYPIPLEAKETCNGNDIYAKNASANQWESFISSNGTTWTDVSTSSTSDKLTSSFTDSKGNKLTYKASLANVCIKAFTRTAPVILKQPASQTVGETQSATFEVDVNGDPTDLKYQWYFNDGIIGGAQSSSYTITGVTTANAGNYHVVIKNDKGETTSAEAALTVLPLVSTPTFNPDGGTYKTPWQVKISCNTPGVVIHYTTDGNEPTEKSPVVASGGFVTVNKPDTTLKAKAWKTGWAPSNTKSDLFNITGTVATPTFDLPKPGLYNSEQKVTLKCATEGATIRYTTDGTEPTEKSPTTYVYSDTDKVTLANNLREKEAVITVKAKAWKTDWDVSATATATYTITGQVAAPKLTPDSASYQDGITVKADSTTTGAVIRYTTSTTSTPPADPTAKSSILPSGGLVIGNDTYIKVKAFKANWTDSLVTSAHYTFDRVAAPTFSLPAGLYYTPKTVTISCATTGATIYYSTGDGAEKQYKAGTPIALAKNTNTVINAIAKKTGVTDSASSSATYNVTDTALAPSFTLKSYSGSQSIVINNKNLNSTSTIRYTLDGSEPTDDINKNPSSKRYTESFTLDYTKVNGPVTIKAKAFVDDWAPSATVTTAYTPVVPSPEFTVKETAKETKADNTEVITKQVITITCPLNDVTIRYTTDGKTPPTASSPIVPETGVVVDHTMTIKAAAFRTGWITNTTSSVASATYTINHVADPVLSLAEGLYYKPQTVTISCATPGAAIYYYKLTGSTPKWDDEEEEGKPVLYKPGTMIPIGAGYTKIKTWAIIKPNGVQSETVEAVYKVTGTVAAPTFSPGSTTLKAGETKAIKISSSTLGASILYTLDGSTPIASKGLPYTGPVKVSESVTVKAIAVLADYVPSNMTSAVYTGTLATPEFDKPSNQTNPFTDEESALVKVKPVIDQGAVMRYTTDGKNPTASSPVVPEDGILVNRNMTIKAQAFKTGWAPSAIISNAYYFKGVATPAFSIPAQTIIKAATAVTITCATPGAEIHYAINGNLNDPITKTNPKYTGKITLGGSAIIRAKAWVNDAESGVGTVNITYTGTVATPTLIVGAGSYSVPQTVTISCQTSDAKIYYTTNGTEPSATNGTQIVSGGTVDITTSRTLKVKAFRTDWTPSATVTAVYTISQVEKPIFSPGDGVSFNPGQPITLNCATTGATIRYTTNGNEPSLSDPAVTPGAKIVLGVGSFTVKARAWKTGLNPSEIATADYNVEGIKPEDLNSRLASISRFTLITDYLHSKFYSYLFFGRFALGAGGSTGIPSNYVWDGPDADGWYTGHSSSEEDGAPILKIKTPNPNEIYLKSDYFDLAAKRDSDGLWDGSLKTKSDFIDHYVTATQFNSIKYNSNISVTFTNAALNQGDGTYQVTGTFTVPGKPAYKIDGRYLFTYDPGLYEFYVTGSETFNKVAKTVDEIYNIVNMVLVDRTDAEKAEAISKEINDRLSAVKAFNLIPDYLKDKFGNFLKTINKDDFTSSTDYTPNTGTTADLNLTWSGPDSDGWYIAYKSDGTTLKFKSPNADTIWYKDISKGITSEGNYVYLVVTRDSNNRWNGTYNASFDNPVDPSGKNRYLTYHVNLIEQIIEADLETGDGTYDVAATCQVPGQPCYSLFAKYKFNVGSQSVTKEQEEFGPCKLGSLTSDQINGLLSSVKMFSFIQGYVGDKFTNYLMDPDKRFAFTNGYQYYEGNGFINEDVPLVWSAPDSTGWCKATITEESMTMTLKFKLDQDNPNTFYFTAAVLTNSFSLTATKGDDNLWSGTLSTVYNDSFEENSQAGDGTNTSVVYSYHAVFSEEFSQADLYTGAGTYTNVKADFTKIKPAQQDHHLLANYVFTYDSASQELHATGSEAFDGTTNTLDETYSKHQGNGGDGGDDGGEGNDGTFTPAQINDVLGSIQSVGLIGQYVKDKFANFLNGGQFALTSSQSSDRLTIPLPPEWFSSTMPTPDNKTQYLYNATYNQIILGNNIDWVFNFRWDLMNLQYFIDITRTITTTLDGKSVQLVSRISFNGDKVNNLWIGSFSMNSQNIGYDASQSKDIIYDIYFAESFSNADLSKGIGNYFNLSASFKVPNENTQSDTWYYLSSPFEQSDLNYYHIVSSISDSTYRIVGQETFNNTAQSFDDTYVY